MGRQNQTITKIKLFLTFAFIAFGAVAASGVPTCDECSKAVGDLVTRLLTDESLAEQIPSSNWSCVHSFLLILVTAREVWTCGSPTWPPASTTISCWSKTSALCWVTAPHRSPKSWNGLARSAKVL